MNSSSGSSMQPRRPSTKKAEDIELTLTTASPVKSTVDPQPPRQPQQPADTAKSDSVDVEEETVDLFKEEDILLRRSSSLRSRVRASSGTQQGTAAGRSRPISLNRDRSYVNVFTRVTSLEPAGSAGRRQSIVAAGAEPSSSPAGFSFGHRIDFLCPFIANIIG